MIKFINYCIKYSSKFEEKIGSSTKFTTPISNDEINSNLKGNHDVSLIFDYLSNNSDLREMIKIYMEFEDLIIRIPSLNPHKEYLPLKYYKWDETIHEKFNLILKDINDSTFQKFIHIGPKGSGKTITQNCWLHENNTQLEKEKIFWVRCDVHKIYQLWNTLLEPSGTAIELVTIEQYLSIQFLYVFVKHKHESDLFKKIYSEIEHENPTFQTRQNRKNPFLKEENFILDGINEAYLNIQTEKGKSKDYSFSIHLIEAVLSRVNITRFAFDRWIDLSESIQVFILAKGYKIMQIVDGIDNVEFLNDLGLANYRKLIANAARFMTTKPENGVFRFISMRNETLTDFNCSLSYSTDPQNFNIHYRRIDHKTSCLNDISAKRIETYFDLMNKKSTYQEKTLLYIKILKKTFITQDKLYETSPFFNYNIRLFLHNKLALTLQILFRYFQTNTDFNIESFNSFYFNSFKRNLFLNGRLFLDSKLTGFNNITQGTALFNIFYYDYRISDSNKWYGLCSTRIIQLLHRSNNITDTELIRKLETLFEYPKSIIQKCLNQLISYGFVTTNTCENFKEIYYKITFKGKNALSLIYNDFDILYYLSLDTPLPNLLIENKFVISHLNILADYDNKEVFPVQSYYRNSSIISVISFILFIHYKHNEEMEILSNEDKKIFKDPIDGLSKRSIFRRLQYFYEKSSEKEKIKQHFRNIGLDNEQLNEIVLSLTSVKNKN